MTGVVSGLFFGNWPYIFVPLIQRGYVLILTLWLNGGVLLFAGALIFQLWWWRSLARRRLYIIMGMTLLGWILAHLAYQMMVNLSPVNLKSAIALSAGEVPAEFQPIATSYETLMIILIAGVASIIGAALTILAVPVSGRLRRLNLRVWGIFGSALAAVPMVMLGSNASERAGLIALFVTWQMWVAGSIAWSQAKGEDIAAEA